MTTASSPTTPSGTRAGRTVVAIGNEVHKGLVHGWAERRQILMELGMFVPLFLLFAGLFGRGEAIVEGRFEWTLAPEPTTWLFIGFTSFLFFYLQAQKLFWRLLGEVQTGTLEQVYLSPLPSWLVAAAGRVVASILETLVVVAALYVSVRALVAIDMQWHPDALLAVAALVLSGFGYALAIGGLALRWKRTEVVNDGLHVIVLFAGGALVPLPSLPTWLAVVGRLLPITHPLAALRTTLVDGHALSLTSDGGLVWLLASAVGWMVIGAVAFHLGDTAARRDGTLTRA